EPLPGLGELPHVGRRPAKRLRPQPVPGPSHQLLLRMIPRTLFASLAFPAFLLLGTGGAFAQDADTSGDTRYFVGLGAGFETGNGLQLGIGRGKDALQLGLGLLYDDADARTDYSIGLRYL